jgi:hypothetical protein
MRIQRVRKGQQLKASTVNKLIDAAAASTINEGRGSRLFKGGSGGVSVHTPRAKERYRPPTKALPWEVSLMTIEGVIVPVVSKGRMYDGLAGIEEITPTVEDPTAAAIDGDVCCLEYTYETELWEYVIVKGEDYEAITQSEDEPPILLTSRVPLAQIELIEGSSPAKLAVKQMVRNHLVQIDACINGSITKHLVAL